MKDRILIILILLVTFLSIFFLTTLVNDLYCKATGYYVPGLEDARDISTNE